MIIQEAVLPISLQLALLDNEGLAWKRIFGTRRSKTLRNRARAWSKFRLWLVAYKARIWPEAIADPIAYVEEAILQGCSVSFPNEFHAALSLLEQVGRVPDDVRISEDALWISHMGSWNEELQSRGGAGRGPANPYTVAIMIALEIFVQEDHNPIFLKLVAWVMLFAIWASMRVDDIQNILPETVRLSTRGLSARLSQTKTTGPGRVHGQVRVFVKRSVSLTGINWIELGVNLLASDDLCFPRDYLVPAPNQTWMGFRNKLLEPPQLANYFRVVHEAWEAKAR